MKQPFFDATLEFHDDETATIHWRVPVKYLRIMLGLNASLSFNSYTFVVALREQYKKAQPEVRKQLLKLMLCRHRHVSTFD
jgi:hypothetical protein